VSLSDGGLVELMLSSSTILNLDLVHST